VNLDSHNSASRHVLGHVKAWEGEGGHSEGICRGPGTESKCERQKTQRSGGRNCHKVKKQKKKRKKKIRFWFLLFFFVKSFTLRLEL
jgi:hypothetical protein